MVRTIWLALASAAMLGAAAQADTPLPPPSDFTRTFEGATVTGDVSANLTTIATDDGLVWSIPRWARSFVLSPDRRSILVLGHGVNLVSSRDPAQIVATVWYLDGAAVRQSAFQLRDTMDPADMPQTTSNFLWLDTIRTADEGWELDLSDGKTITITYR